VYLKNRYMIVSSRRKCQVYDDPKMRLVYLWWLILCIREYDHEIACILIVIPILSGKGLNGIVSQKMRETSRTLQKNPGEMD